MDRDLEALLAGLDTLIDELPAIRAEQRRRSEPGHELSEEEIADIEASLSTLLE